MEFHQSSNTEHRAHCLALDAAGIPYQAFRTQAGFAIAVADADARQAQEEIEAYSFENSSEVTQRVVESRPRGSGWFGVVGYALLLCTVFALQQQGVFGFHWSSDGKVQAGLIRDGEIWRSVTALTLHADLVHLLSNIVIGGLVGFFTGQLFGAGLAWLAILITGAAGNLISASFRPADHAALGASTAVFAGIGLLSAYQWIQKRGTAGPKLAKFAPIIGGMVLLSFLGTGGERTDVISHVTGFLAGLLGGALMGSLGTRLEFTRRGQGALGMFALLIVLGAWLLALKTGESTGPASVDLSYS